MVSSATSYLYSIWQNKLKNVMIIYKSLVENINTFMENFFAVRTYTTLNEFDRCVLIVTSIPDKERVIYSTHLMLFLPCSETAPSFCTGWDRMAPGRPPPPWRGSPWVWPRCAGPPPCPRWLGHWVTLTHNCYWLRLRCCVLWTLEVVADGGWSHLTLSLQSPHKRHKRGG